MPVSPTTGPVSTPIRPTPGPYQVPPRSGAAPVRPPVAGAPSSGRSFGLGAGRSQAAGTVSGRELVQRRGRKEGFSLLRLVAFVLILAALTIVVFMVALRPIIRGIVVGVAGSNSSVLSIGFVEDLVKEDLGDKLTAPAGTDPKEVTFTVAPGDSPGTIASDLVAAGVLRDARAFLVITIDKKLDTQFKAGTFTVSQTMTPDELATALLTFVDPHVIIPIRTGLRLEQIAALIEAKSPDRRLDTLKMSAQDFLDIVRNPPQSLLADYPWVVIPKGGTLEGYLAGGNYRVLPDTTADQLVRMMLDKFRTDVGADRMQVPAERGLTWSQVLALASLVEKETARDADRAKIAGVYQNRLDPSQESRGYFQSDPTIFYVNDSLQLAKLPLAKWTSYLFWSKIKTQLPANLPANLAGYNTYTTKGLPAGPICTPTAASIDAALNPDTKGGYLYFLALKDGTTVFAKTHAQHLKNIAKYGQ